MSETEEWLREHKGPLRDIIGEVWYCEDSCGCSQARVVARHVNRTDSRFIVPVLVWEGPFHTEHEPGARDELADYRATLSEADAAGITWPA